MDDLEAYEMYQKILDYKKFYIEYAEHQGNFENTIRAFNKLLIELDDTLLHGKLRMLAKSRYMADKLVLKNLEERRNFVNDNKLQNSDIEILTSLITKNVANNNPTLELFPGKGQFLPYAVASEPLYVVDRFKEILDEAASVLNNDFYSTRRLRKYVVSDYNLSQLPQESFGLVYCFNEFFQADEQYIYSWACEVYKLLESGGKFIFNFLPYDQHWAIKATFTKIYSVIDYKSLIEKLKDFGYELDNCEIKEFCASYICIKKPGTLAPRIKNSGSIAEIIDI
jgi:hypothetical protein